MGVYTCRNCTQQRREDRGYVPDPSFEKPFCSRPTGALLVNCLASRRSIITKQSLGAASLRSLIVIDQDRAAHFLARSTNEPFPQQIFDRSIVRNEMDTSKI